MRQSIINAADCSSCTIKLQVVPNFSVSNASCQMQGRSELIPFASDINFKQHIRNTQRVAALIVSTASLTTKTRSVKSGTLTNAMAFRLSSNSYPGLSNAAVEATAAVAADHLSHLLLSRLMKSTEPHLPLQGRSSADAKMKTMESMSYQNREQAELCAVLTCTQACCCVEQLASNELASTG